MLMDERTELLIQRCVDDELSPAETCSLLQRLDGLDGAWKHLACSLLEDRRLQQLFEADGAADLEPVQTEPVQHPVRTPKIVRLGLQSIPTRSTLRSWWGHPVTSLALCAAIAFVAGLLIPDRDSGERGAGALAGSTPAAASGSVQQPAMLAGDGGPQRFRIQVPQSGQELDVPVYLGLDDLVRDNRQHPLFSERLSDGDEAGGVVQWMVAPMDGDRIVVIPVTEDRVGQVQ